MPMSTIEATSVENRFLNVEKKLNEIQVALNNLATKGENRSLLNIRQAEIIELQELLEQLEQTNGASLLTVHKADSDAHASIFANYYLRSVFVDSTTGTSDAGKPIKTDSSGKLDPSFVELVLEDHGTLSGLDNDDHTQYLTTGRADTWYATKSHTGLLDIGTNTHAQIDIHIADNSLHFTEASIDHGSIAGLLDDDHTQYILVDGTRAFTGDLLLGNNDILNVNQLSFLTSGIAHSHQEGSIHWDENDRTLNIDTEVTDVQIQVGQEMVVKALNKTGDVISNGQIVYISGAQGNRPTINLADADIEAEADNTIGVATHNIANNTTGYIAVFGLVRDINTSGTPVGESWNAGDEVFLSSTPGALTKVEPSAPSHKVKVGRVIVAHNTQGILFVSVKIGADLDDVHDVDASAPTNLDLLVYNSAAGYWQNVAASGLDHGAFSGLDGDHHTQYLLTDGTRPMTGPLGFDEFTASAPMLKRSGAGLVSRLGNDSDYADVTGKGWYGTSHIRAGNTGYLYWNGGSRLSSPVDGDILLGDAAATDFGLLQFGGTTSSYPALKRNGTGLDVRLADDSDYANVALEHLSAYNGMTVQAGHFLLPTDNDAVTPTLAFGDGDSGFYEASDDVVNMAIAGGRYWIFNTNGIAGGNANSCSIRVANTSATNPNLCPDKSALTTGVGANTPGEISLICIGNEIIRLATSAVTVNQPSTFNADVDISGDFSVSDMATLSGITPSDTALHLFGDLTFNPTTSGEAYIGTGGGDLYITAPLVTGPIEFPEDAGAVVLFDMPVSASAPVSGIMSVDFAIDSNTIFTAFAEADGSGGVQSLALKMGSARIQGTKGSDVASADELVLGDGNYFEITGTTTINHIRKTNWQAGSVVILKFNASVTVTHNAGSPILNEADILLAGAGNFSATADDTLTLVYDGTYWRETARTVI